MTNVAVLLKTNKNGHALPSPHNVYRVLRDHPDWQGVLRHNLLDEADEYWPEETDPLGLEKRQRIDDQILFDIRLWLEGAQTWTRPPGKELVIDAVEAVCGKTRYHPVRDYLAPLAASWDGKERIDHWLADYCGAEDSDYTSAVGRKFLIGAAQRAFQPGCKLDTMLTLVGAQGIRKSSAVRILGRGWTSDTPFEIGSKDGFEAIRGSWLVEIPELAGMSGKDVERLKAFFSSPEDRYRPPYARKTIVTRRSCAFIGTTNDRDFLKDATGSRRFLCVDVDEIDLEGLEEVVDQLWGEAAMYALRGDQWWLTDEEMELAREAAEAFTAVDSWEDVIVPKVHRLEKVHTSQIYDWLDVVPKDQHAGTAQRIVRIMCGRLGWKRPANPFWIGEKKARGFTATEK